MFNVCRFYFAIKDKKKLVYATCEQKFGVIESKMQIFNNQSIFNHSVEVVSGIFKLEASELLKKNILNKKKI